VRFTTDKSKFGEPVTVEVETDETQTAPKAASTSKEDALEKRAGFTAGTFPKGDIILEFEDDEEVVIPDTAWERSGPPPGQTKEDAIKNLFRGFLGDEAGDTFADIVLSGEPPNHSEDIEEIVSSQMDVQMKGDRQQSVSDSDGRMTPEEQRYQAELEAYTEQWPNYCRGCGASGEVPVNQLRSDPDPSQAHAGGAGNHLLRSFGIQREVDCPECIGQEICPRCGAETMTQEAMQTHRGTPHCTECGWYWGENKDDCAPRKWATPWEDPRGSAIARTRDGDALQTHEDWVAKLQPVGSMYICPVCGEVTEKPKGDKLQCSNRACSSRALS
jgi:hypothetical protein